MNLMARWWDWIDARDIDKHTVSIVVLYGTKILTSWAMAFAATHADKPGLEIAAIITAVTGPYMVLQAACIKFYFNARTTSA
jgi:hypothetical protein